MKINISELRLSLENTRIPFGGVPRSITERLLDIAVTAVKLCRERNDFGECIFCGQREYAGGHYDDCPLKDVEIE